MTKADLVTRITSSTNLKKAEAERVLNAFLMEIQGILKEEGKLTLAGLGTFHVAQREAREGRNPATGEPIQIKARKVVRFRPGKALKEAVK